MARLYLAAGFLGAGKTTFLRNFLPLLDGKLALIINEYGSQDVDGAFLRGVNASLSAVCGGSILCTCRVDQFEKALDAALADGADTIVVEASGLTDPSGVQKALTRYRGWIEYMGCICVADARRLAKVISTCICAKKQLETADVVLLNKTDAATEAEKQAALAVIKAHTAAPVFATSMGAIDAAWREALLRPQVIIKDGSLSILDVSLRSMSAYVDELSHDELLDFLEAMAPATYRIKGFAVLREGAFMVDCVGPAVKLVPYGGDIARPSALTLLSGSGLGFPEALRKARDKYAGRIKIQ